MQIARNLKIIIPVYEGEELLLSVYAEPITRLVFEANYKILAKAWSDLNAAGIGSIGLMTTAAFSLKEAALALYGPTEGETRYRSFLTEMLRTTTVIITQSGSWVPAPYENAKSSKLLTEDDVATVESLIAFFTLVSRMVDPHWAVILRTAIELNYGVQFTSLNCMEYITSLKTLNPEDNSGKKGI